MATSSDPASGAVPGNGPLVLVHGGAWDIPLGETDAHLEGMERALRIGRRAAERRKDRNSPGGIRFVRRLVDGQQRGADIAQGGLAKRAASGKPAEPGQQLGTDILGQPRRHYPIPLAHALRCHRSTLSRSALLPILQRTRRPRQSGAEPLG